MISFSIIICTYNPNPSLLQRLLYAIADFENTDIEYEVILIDNNSSPAISENKDVRFFLSHQKDAKLINQPIPGLTPSRIEGIRQAKYDWIIFFDDDNEPANDYLTQVKTLIENYPQTGIWGPGKVNIVYTEQQANPFLEKIKWLFQQRDYSETIIDNNSIEGSEYYPYGTGMIAHKKILDTYSEKVEGGNYTMSDRAGKNLSSAGDIQILFTGIKMGYYAGSSNLLTLNHLITPQKTSRKHVNKLVYALNSTQLKAYNEVFPERSMVARKIDNMDVIKTFITALRSYKIHQQTFTRSMFITKKMGELNARVLAHNYSTPFLLSLFENFYLS